jgi:hypothetical protein
MYLNSSMCCVLYSVSVIITENVQVLDKIEFLFYLGASAI